jgi:predicted phage-related endonuclease
MPAEKYILPDRAAWLAARKNHIGGSDATVCVGMVYRILV